MQQLPLIAIFKNTGIYYHTSSKIANIIEKKVENSVFTILTHEKIGVTKETIGLFKVYINFNLLNSGLIKTAFSTIKDGK